MIIENREGLTWEFAETADGWALGSLSLRGKPVERPATKGLLALRNQTSGEVRWLAAARGEAVDSRGAWFSGQQELDGVNVSWSVDVALRDDLPAADFTARWSVDKDLSGWEVCLAYHDGFANDWRVQSYPWAGNSEAVDISPMRYCGVPGALVYQANQSLVLLFAMDSKSDYLNPTTWSDKTGFHFFNRRTACCS